MASKFIERLTEDEGLTAGLADEEAGLLLSALRDRVSEATKGRSNSEAEAAFASIVERGRLIAKIVAALCYDGEPDKAKALWSKAGGSGSMDDVPADDAAAAMRELLSREGLKRA